MDDPELKMTSPIGMTKSIKNRPPPGTDKDAFTLVELILVMVLIATVSALVVPSMGKSFRSRTLNDSATKFFALTEYARDEAMSSGVPMVIWAETETGRYGLKPKGGYEQLGGRSLQFSLPDNIRFGQTTSKSKGAENLIEFSAGGFLEHDSIDQIQFSDGSESSTLVAKNGNATGYCITNISSDALLHGTR